MKKLMILFMLISMYGHGFAQSTQADLQTVEPLRHQEQDICDAFSGSLTACENPDTEYDDRLDNWLKVELGSNTDALIKLIRKSEPADKCIRTVYIHAGDTYFIRHIPQGIYYLKIAYGFDLRLLSEEGKCYYAFLRNAIYETGEETIDYRIVPTEGGWSIPSYALFLDVHATSDHVFSTDHITEAEFNR